MADDSHDILIRRSDDVARLSAVARATFLEAFADVIGFEDIAKRAQSEDSEAAFQARIADGAATWLAVLERTGVPVGFTMLTEPELPEIETGPGDMELKRIYLLHRFHGGGTGKRLYDAVETEARTRECRRLLLGVHADNAAVGWYERQGFTTVGERSFRVGDAYFHDRIMAKSLSGRGDK